MDELDLLERFWEHIPEPDPGRVHVARSALMERIGTDPRLERLRRPRRRVSRRWAFVGRSCQRSDRDCRAGFSGRHRKPVRARHSPVGVPFSGFRRRREA
jgi:hypothetical protein